MSHDERYGKSLQPDFGVCGRCGSIFPIQHCSFYFLEKGEGTYKGSLCFPCMSKVLFQSTLTNLLFMFWTVWGLFVGPIYTILNLIKYIKHILLFARKSNRTEHN